MISPVAGMRDKPHSLSIAPPQHVLHRHRRVLKVPSRCGAFRECFAIIRPRRRVDTQMISQIYVEEDCTAISAVYNGGKAVNLIPQRGCLMIPIQQSEIWLIKMHRISAP
jgi:hypothetical protein